MKTACFLLASVVVAGCGPSDIIEISFDKRLIPEGIAVDEKSGAIFLSSIHKKKIVKVSGSKTEDMINSGEFGFKSGVGIDIKDGKLFAIASDINKNPSSSVLLVLDIQSGEMLNTYQLTDTVDHFMNDLAISATNVIYISDSDNNCVYFLNYPDGEIEVFMRTDEINYPNGIAISKDGSKLFVGSSLNGVRIVDIKSRKFLSERYSDFKEVRVDGLKYYKGNLYGIRNWGDEYHGLIKIELSDDETTIVGVKPLLMDHDLMDIPTTVAISNGSAFILANSQLLNLDQDKNEIIDPAKLTNTYVLKYNLRAE